MRSGKPPAPWRRKKARAISAVRIGVLCVVFALVAGFALYRLRPGPLPWHALGAERIETPAFDIADDRTRLAATSLAGDGVNNQHHRWLGDSCDLMFGAPSEVYVLSHDGMGYTPHAEDPYRIVVTLDRGGQVMYEQMARRADDWPIVQRRLRVFDEADAERFRSLLLEGGYAQMTPFGSWRTDNPTLTLESCVHGRYYGVIRIGSGEGPSLQALAERIKEFALTGAEPGLVPP